MQLFVTGTGLRSFALDIPLSDDLFCSVIFIGGIASDGLIHGGRLGQSHIDLDYSYSWGQVLCDIVYYRRTGTISARPLVA